MAPPEVSLARYSLMFLSAAEEEPKQAPTLKVTQTEVLDSQSQLVPVTRTVEDKMRDSQGNIIATVSRQVQGLETIYQTDFRICFANAQPMLTSSSVRYMLLRRDGGNTGAFGIPLKPRATWVWRFAGGEEAEPPVASRQRGAVAPTANATNNPTSRPATPVAPTVVPSPPSVRGEFGVRCDRLWQSLMADARLRQELQQVLTRPDSAAKANLHFVDNCSSRTSEQIACAERSPNAAGLAMCPSIREALRDAMSAPDVIDPAELSRLRMRGYQTEAQANLKAVSNAFAALVAESGASFVPPAPVGLTPAEDCCRAGGTCTPNRAAWQQPTWKALGFEVTEPSRYHLSFETTLPLVTLRASGDPLCSGQTDTWELNGLFGNFKVTWGELQHLEAPARPAQSAPPLVLTAPAPAAAPVPAPAPAAAPVAAPAPEVAQPPSGRGRAWWWASSLMWRWGRASRFTLMSLWVSSTSGSFRD